MKIRIEWTIRAERHLRRALARRICCDARNGGNNSHSTTICGSGMMENEMENLDEVLKCTFPEARSIVVLDHMLGYRIKEDVFTLLVEVFGDDQTAGSFPAGSYVVKIGPEEPIRDEVKAWESCCPRGMRHDLVFLPLRIGCKEYIGDPPKLSLVYGDAHQFLGVETIATFEQAALGGVLHDSPSVTSIGLVLWELFERIGHLLYAHSFEERPEGIQPNATDGKGRFALHVPHLYESLGLWNAEPLLELRKKTNLISKHGPGEFLDPVDYLQYVNHFVPFRVEDGGMIVGGETPCGTGHSADQPRLESLVPVMLRGCAHGDLHGRNILVGLVRGKALWPTLFDYEDMSECKLVGWDFVKLETELKIRAYPQVFSGTQSQFIEAIQKFERELGEETECRYRGDAPWTTVTGSSSAPERLRQVLLEVRHRAALHLGIERGRPDRWLEEYYFLLACYGVCTSRFPNLQPKERLGAFVSAGTAAARLSWPRTIRRLQRQGA